LRLRGFSVGDFKAPQAPKLNFPCTTASATVTRLKRELKRVFETVTTKTFRSTCSKNEGHYQEGLVYARIIPLFRKATTTQ